MCASGKSGKNEEVHLKTLKSPVSSIFGVRKLKKLLNNLQKKVWVDVGTSINIFKIENEVGMEAVKQYKDAFSLHVKTRVIGTEDVGYSLHVGCLLKRQHKLKSFAEIEKNSQRELPNYCITFVQSQALNLILFFLDTKFQISFFTQTVR